MCNEAVVADGLGRNARPYRSRDLLKGGAKEYGHGTDVQYVNAMLEKDDQLPCISAEGDLLRRK